MSVWCLISESSDEVPADGVEEVYSFVGQVSQYTFQGQSALSAEQLAEVVHPDLLPTLRGYQKRAVKWMLNRERRDPDANSKPYWLIEEKFAREKFRIFHFRIELIFVLEVKIILQKELEIQKKPCGNKPRLN